MNLATIIDGHADDARALVVRGQVTTYGQLRDEVARLRGGLSRLGVTKGDRVAMVAANTAFFPSVYLAVLGLGAVAVPLNPTSPAAELDRELASVRPKAVVVGAGARTAMTGIDVDALGIGHTLVPEGVALDGALSLDEVAGGEPTPVVDVDPSHLAVLIFTSGTAGTPKAAMLTHGNLHANLVEIQQHPGLALAADTISLGVLPLFHIFGLNVVLGLTLAAGGMVVLIERFDPATALDTIANHGVTMVAGAPPMFAAWAALPDADPRAMATVRLAVSGAAPLDPTVAIAFEQRYGIPIWEGYGLTEAAPIVTSSILGGKVKPGSVGIPIPGVEVRLVDDDGEDALIGDTGEMWVKGPNVFPGYWEDEDATRNALTPDGWLRTGDLAVADEDGYLWLVDRAKDLIIVSGFNVFPGEVEDVLRSHPSVADAAVIGVKHPHSGEAVKAYVVTRPGKHLEEEELSDYAAQHLARYKCPSKVLFVEALPYAATGKVLRRELT